MKLAPTWHWRAQYSLGFKRQPLDHRATPDLFLRAAGVAHAVEEVVELGQLFGHPRGALLGEHQLHAGMPFERAADDEMGERSVREPRHLEQEDDRRRHRSGPSSATRCRCGD